MVSSLESDPLLKQVPLVEGWKVLAPVVLFAKIGQGGMGAVYRGRHLDFDIDVAVKCLRPSLAAEDEQFIQRFKREARLAATLTHENLVRVYEARKAYDLHYLVMEFVDGETARDRVQRKGPLEEQEAATIILGAARGLARAHRNRDVVVHRDVKPDNILISRHGEVKLLDLGIAKAMESDGSVATFSTQGVIGTPQYMAPEQWERDQVVGPPTDIWAFGATLYFLLTGENAIRQGTERQIYVDVCQKPFPDVRTKRPAISPALAGILKKCMHKEAEQRYSDAGHLADALGAFIGQRGPSLVDEDTGVERTLPLVSPPPMPTIKRIRSHVENATGVATTPPPSGTMVVRPAGRRWWWIGGGVAAAVAATLGVIFWPKPPASGVDSKGPGLSSAYPSAGTELVCGESKTITLEFDEDLSTARAGEKDASRITEKTAEFELVAPDDGKRWEIPFSVTDKQGNPTTGKVRYELRPKPLVTAPDIDLASIDPARTTFTSEDTLLVKGQVNHAVGNKILLSIDGATKDYPLQDGGKFRIDAPLPMNSAATLRLSYADAKDVEFQVVHDSLKPEITPELPADDALYTKDDSTTVVVRVSDRNIDFVQVDKQKMTDLGQGRYQFEKLTLKREKENVLEVEAVDKAKNLGHYRFYVTHDTVAPKLTSASPAEQTEYKAGDKFTATLQFNEPLSSVTSRSSSSVRTDATMALIDLTYPDKPEWTVDYEVQDRAKNSSKGTLKYQRRAPDALPPPVIKFDGLTLVNEKIYVKSTTLRIQGKIENFVESTAPVVTLDSATIPCSWKSGTWSAELPLKPEAVGTVQVKYPPGLAQSFTVIQDGKQPEFTRVSPAEEKVSTREASLNLAVRVRDPNLESVQLGGKPLKEPAGDEYRVDAFALKEGVNTVEFVALDRAGNSNKCAFVVTRDSLPPELAKSVPERNAQVKPGKLSVHLTFNENIARVLTGTDTVPGAQKDATFDVVVPGIGGPFFVKGEVEDSLGNRGKFEIPLTVVIEAAPAPTPTPPKPGPDPSPPAPAPAPAPSLTKDFPGFTSAGVRNAGGYSLQLRHERSGVELVAVDFDQTSSAKPTLYVSTKLVTEKQYDGKGADVWQCSISAESIQKWLKSGRGQGLELPTDSDWMRYSNASVPGFQATPTGKVELLLGKPDTTNWPTRSASGKSGTMSRSGSLSTNGFRVVFRG